MRLPKAPYFELIRILVKRVHWLRARAQLQRWQEELKLVAAEMTWTVRYFVHKSDWCKDMVDRRVIAANDRIGGCVAYAARKAEMWIDRAIRADTAFRQVNFDYQSPL